MWNVELDEAQAGIKIHFASLSTGFPILLVLQLFFLIVKYLPWRVNATVSSIVRAVHHVAKGLSV